MKFIHRICEGSSVASNIDSQDGRGFCLGDNDGGYLWLDQAPTSRYQGWFVNVGQTLIKTVENIELVGGTGVSAIINNLWSVKRVRGAVTEEFFNLGKHRALAYRVSQRSDIALTLDIKESFKNDEFGRDYRLDRTDFGVVVGFHNENGGHCGDFYLAIVSDSPRIKILQDWVARDYSYDRQRGSQPFLRWVFKALVIENASSVVIGAGTDRDRAVKEGLFVFNNLASLRSKRRRDLDQTAALFSRNFGINHKHGLHADSELAASGLCSVNALRSLLTPREGGFGLLAGFPWFFQFWQRDEALSLAGLSEVNMTSALSVFWRLISDLENSFDGAAPDGIGWIFFAADEFIARHLLSLEEKRRIARLLEIIISKLIKDQTIGGFAVTDQGPTWMDSLDRSGARLEIQALRLGLYRLASRISASSSKREFYRHLEIDLLLKTRKKFAGNALLADGYDPLTETTDTTVRPNIFLAAYVYPQLLENDCWQRCFDNVLPKLWLDWGGLASIDINDARFHPIHSGEQPASYHNGDSWFYVNNIAALVLHRTNPIKYHDRVKKIFAAGKRNILWGPVCGYPSEISSASAFKPAGCFNQAWSGATFLELFQEIGTKRQNIGNLGP